MKLDLALPDSIFGFETSLFKIILLPLPLIIGFLISLSLVIIPKINEINDLNVSIASKNNETNLIVAKKNYLMSINKDQLKDDKANLQSALLDKNKTYYLVGVVRAIADNYGYQVKSFSISPGKLKSGSEVQIANKDVMMRIPISVVLVGSKDKQLDLVTALERSLPILTIDRFQIANDQSATELDLGITAYYMSVNQNSTASNLSLEELSLKKEEKDVLSRISEFTKVEASGEASSTGTYVMYQRPNPFSL